MTTRSSTPSPAVAAPSARIEAQKGSEGLEAEKTRHRQIVRQQAFALINQSFGNLDQRVVCEQFEQRLACGAFNINTNHPFYLQANALLKVVGE